MQIFKAYYKIVKRNKIVILIYLGITIGLSFAMTRRDPIAEVFTEEKQNISVIDNDESMFSKAIIDFLDSKHNLVELKDDVDVIQDALYYEDISYLIRIPAGFGDSFTSMEDAKLDITTAENSAGGIYLNNQLEAYLNTYKAYVSMGFSTEEAIEKAYTNSLLTTTVLTTEAEKKTEGPYFQGFFKMMPYGFVSILIHCIGCVMIAFNDEEVSKRMKCSKTSYISSSIQIILASGVLSIVVWLVHLAAVIGVFQDIVLSFDGLGYLILNSLALLFAALGIAFLLASLSKNQTAVTIFGVSGSMLIAFLGGVFVPLDVMSESTKIVSRLVPSYWYITNCEKVYSTKILTDSFKQAFFRGIYIQVAFAIAMIVLAVFISKKKSKAR